MITFQQKRNHFNSLNEPLKGVNMSQNEIESGKNVLEFECQTFDSPKVNEKMEMKINNQVISENISENSNENLMGTGSINN